MFNPNETGCPEYQSLTRRGFLSSMGGSLMGVVPQVTYTDDVEPQAGVSGAGVGTASTSPRDIIVTVFLRGGADGLALVPPWKDAEYANQRLNTRFLPPTNSDKLRRVIDLDGFFGLPQSMAALKPLYDQKVLLLTHMIGSQNPNRSHFDQQHFMEVGQDNSRLYVGWMGRHLSTLSAQKEGALLRGLSLTGNMPEILNGGPLVSTISDLVNFSLPGDGNTTAKRVNWLDKAYQSADPALAAAGANTIKTLSLLQSINYAGYQPTGGAVYNPQVVSTKKDGSTVKSDMAWWVNGFGESMKQAAALIKSDVGLESVHVDFGGWDMHQNEWLFEGRDGNDNPGFGGAFWNFYALASNLNAFFTDLDSVKFSDGTTWMNRVTVVIMTEFGRTVNENGNAGTDHGQGGVMMFLGRNVNGGRVDRTWKTLLSGKGIDPFGGLTVTIDYKVFLGELLEKRMANGNNLGVVFPNYKKPTSGWRGAFK